MILGFTGSQRGPTLDQLATFEWLLLSWAPPLPLASTVEGEALTNVHGILEFHHGDCVGWDAAAHKAVRAHPRPWHIVGHVPDDPSKRAFCDFDEERAPLPYLIRNRMISIASWAMVACPAQRVEQRRSGTWSTIRYLRSARKPLTIVWPDGEYTMENW